MTVEMIKTRINGRWDLLLPKHRAARPEWNTGWEVERLDSMHRNIWPGATVYDIGTEEGDISALLALWCANGGTSMGSGSLYLFEPNQRVWPNVKAIFEANGLKPPAGAWTGFVGPERRDAVIDSWRLDEDEWVSDGWPSCADGPIIGDHGFLNICERPDVPVVSIDWLVQHGVAEVPHVITMDVEGAEWEVLKGAENVMAAHKPIIYTSIHPEFMSQMYGQHANDMKDWMLDRGYEFKILGWDHEWHLGWAHAGGRQLL